MHVFEHWVKIAWISELFRFSFLPIKFPQKHWNCLLSVCMIGKHCCNPCFLLRPEDLFQPSNTCKYNLYYKYFLWFAGLPNVWNLISINESASTFRCKHSDFGEHLGVGTRQVFSFMSYHIFLHASIFSYASSSTLHPCERVGRWVSRSFEVA